MTEKGIREFFLWINIFKKSKKIGYLRNYIIFVFGKQNNSNSVDV